MVILPSSWRTQPWKNGRGVTREVLRLPDVDDYEVRISVADVVESGPFSTFPGYRRWTLLLEGGPIYLGRASTDELLALDGDHEVEARVDAPGRLLNVIAKPHVQVGVGESIADVVFSLVDRSTTIYDAPARVSGVWIKR